MPRSTRRPLFLLFIISIMSLGAFLAGCATRGYTFNHRHYRDIVSATDAVNTFYSRLENDVTPAKTQLPLKVVVVVPSYLYARANWVRYGAKFATLTEDHYAFTANQRVREARSVATHLQLAKAFKTVIIVDADADSNDITSSHASQLSPDMVLKKTASGRWQLTPFPAGKPREVPNPWKPMGKGFMRVMIAAIQRTAASLQK